MGFICVDEHTHTHTYCVIELSLWVLVLWLCDHPSNIEIGLENLRITMWPLVQGLL